MGVGVEPRGVIKETSISVKTPEVEHGSPTNQLWKRTQFTLHFMALEGHVYNSGVGPEGVQDSFFLYYSTSI